MRKKKPHVATLDEVRITRQGEEAVIAYLDPNVSTVHLRIGFTIHGMTDQEILDLHNEIILARQRMVEELTSIAVEVPLGRPQIKYSPECDQWTPRGDVLRCVIDDGGPDGEPTIWIDDRELSLIEFGRLLTTYAGWGMRITFVPEEEIGDSPLIALRDPDDSE